MSDKKFRVEKENLTCIRKNLSCVQEKFLVECWARKSYQSTYSTANSCKNCTKCGKDFKIGPNGAYNI